MATNLRSNNVTITQMPSLVSVIIPLFNAEKHIGECINSVLNQTWKNIEIIVVDDGSTDNSLKAAKHFKAEGVIIISQENKGAGAARNKGITLAKGDYVQFLDADDLLSENKIESQLLCLNGSTDKLSICKTVHFYDGTKNIPKADVKNEWYHGNYDDPVDFLVKLYSGWEVYYGFGGMVAVHAWLTPKSIIDRAGLWNEKLTVDDDGEFFCRVLLNSQGVKYSAEGINYYRKYNESKSLSSMDNDKAIASRMLATDLKFEHLKKFVAVELLHNIFARHYWDIGVSAYPKYKALSKAATKKAKQFNYTGVTYKSGKLATILSKLFGWKLVRTLSFIKHNH